jgi:PTS system fructose-specific IIA component/PTS system nitrogen regulatory IIA component
MKFSEFMCTDAISAEVLAGDKQGAIREMTQALLDAGQIAQDDYESIVDALLRREELGSTGIGRGVAIPHTKHPSVGQTIATVGVSRSGIDFASLDGKPVYVLLLLISPSDRPDIHLRAMETAARQLRAETFCRFLRQAKSVEEIKQLLDDSDDDQLR